MSSKGCLRIPPQNPSVTMLDQAGFPWEAVLPGAVLGAES
ncbi:hypothetical protein LINPERHAP1_LOCUS35864 [Linum perenne]